MITSQVKVLVGCRVQVSNRELKLYSKIYSIFNIFLFKLLVINNAFICKTYLFKFVLSLSLKFLNSLGFLNSEKKKCKLKYFNIFQKYLYKKQKHFLPPKFGAFSSRGLGNDLIGSGLRPALVTPEYSRKLVSLVTQVGAQK